MSTTINGYLLLADVSGYTSFMAMSELPHAQEIMSEILELIVGRLTQATTLSEIEGDAVFVYAPGEQFKRGETLVELIEATYVAFKDRLASMIRQTTCTCKACASMPKLDLKFVTHFGEFALQTVSNVRKPLGSPVNVAHRLLKNHVAEATGWKAYALFTQECLDAMSLGGSGWHSGQEYYEHIGNIATRSFDLAKRFEEITSTRRIILSEKDAHYVCRRLFPVAPAVLWDFMNIPEKRDLWMKGTRWNRGDRPKGRTGPGASNHCAHGKGKSIEQILDWKPFEYVTNITIDGKSRLLMTQTFTPSNGGTQFEWRYKLEQGMPSFLARPMMKLVMRFSVKPEEDLVRLASLISDNPH